jgi:hypothetical protein
MPRKRQPEALSAADIADELLENPGFRTIVVNALVDYIETGGTRNPVNIGIMIISDGVTPPTQAIAADRFDLEHPRD